MTILIIKQDDDVCRILHQFLINEGHRAICIPGDTDSVTKALQHCPDLIIVDITLSELSAMEIIKRLLSKRNSAGKKIPLIVISDFPSLEFELPQVSDFLCKPVNLERLRESIETFARGEGKSGTRAIHPALSPEDHKKFQGYLIDQSGLNFDGHNMKMLERGLIKRMTALRVNSYNDYYEYLTTNSERRQELQKLLQFLTIGESFFFRQQGHFTALLETVLPDIINNSGNKRIRLLSAGCSTGEEPYSMAMTVMEAIPDWKSRDIRILGADINNHSLMRALEGGYNNWKTRNTEKKYLDKYFICVGERTVVNDEVKALVDFTHLDLREVHSSSYQLMAESFDAIFCRNVMIYFSTETTRNVVESFAAALKPGGYLFLGHAETLAQISTKFDRRLEYGVVYYRKKDGQQPSVDIPRAAVPVSSDVNMLRVPDNTNFQQPLPSIHVSPEERLDLDMLYDKAIALKHDKKYDLAAKLFEQILDIKPDHKSAMLGKAMILAYGGRFHESMVWCNRALLIDDLLPEAYFIRGFAYEMTERTTEAIREYRKAILLQMDLVMPHYQLGRLYSRNGQHKAGIRSLKNSLKLLEQTCETIIPFSTGLSREMLIDRLRDDIIGIVAESANIAEGRQSFST